MLLNYNDRHHVFRDVAVLVIDAPSPAPPRILEGRARTVLHGGYTHVRVFLPKDIHNRSPLHKYGVTGYGCPLVETP